MDRARGDQRIGVIVRNTPDLVVTNLSMALQPGLALILHWGNHYPNRLAVVITLPPKHDAGEAITFADGPVAAHP